MLSLLIWILVGAFAGWVASMIMKTDAQMGALENIVAGIIGALLGGWLLGLFGIEVADGQLSIPSILSAIFGAVVLIFLVKLVRGGSRAA